jgi:Domain of unknown function (DUF1835)
MIHLVNGGSTLATLRTTQVPGEKFSIDDVLAEGPIVDGLHTEASWRERADFLNGFFSISPADYLSGHASTAALLRESLTHDEIVLWFEFDLHCQANLLYFLDWYASHELGSARLTLVCPETFPGRDHFRGLGELRAEELESLFPARSEITDEQLRLASRAWQAYGSVDPRAIETLLSSDTSALPLLAPALRAHLERFPSTDNGLGVVAQTILRILGEQPLESRKLLWRTMKSPSLFRHGMGDQMILSYLNALQTGASPLVAGGQNLEITPAGRSVLENRGNAIEMNGIDHWYGGAHLTRDKHWLWDSQQMKLSSSV